MLPDYIWQALNASEAYLDEDEIEIDLVACDHKEVLSFVAHYPHGPNRLAIIRGEGACEGIGAILLPGEVAQNTNKVHLMIFQAFRVARLEMQQRDDIYVNAMRMKIEGGTPEEAGRAAFDVRIESRLSWRERVGLLKSYEERGR